MSRKYRRFQFVRPPCEPPRLWSQPSRSTSAPGASAVFVLVESEPCCCAGASLSAAASASIEPRRGGRFEAPGDCMAA